MCFHMIFSSKRFIAFRTREPIIIHGLHSITTSFVYFQIILPAHQTSALFTLKRFYCSHYWFRFFRQFLNNLFETILHLIDIPGEELASTYAFEPSGEGVDDHLLYFEWVVRILDKNDFGVVIVSRDDAFEIGLPGATHFVSVGVCEFRGLDHIDDAHTMTSSLVVFSNGCVIMKVGVIKFFLGI